jgi:hypothetical protein
MMATPIVLWGNGLEKKFLLHKARGSVKGSCSLSFCERSQYGVLLLFG